MFGYTEKYILLENYNATKVILLNSVSDLSSKQSEDYYENKNFQEKIIFQLLTIVLSKASWPPTWHSSDQFPSFKHESLKKKSLSM